MKCPIDNEPCEGANGRKNSSECVRKCHAGQLFIVAMNRGVTVKEKHGNPFYAKRNSCKCDPCVEALKVYRREERKERRRKARESRPPVVYPHPSYKRAVREGCRCAKCKSFKKAYLKDKNAKQQAKRKLNKELYGDRDKRQHDLLQL